MNIGKKWVLVCKIGFEGMVGQFNIKKMGDFSGDLCGKYINLIFPFTKIMDLKKPEQSKENIFFSSHIQLAHKFVSTQVQINDYITYWKGSLKIIDCEIGEHLKKQSKDTDITTFQWSDPSLKLENDFKEIIEFCALRLQDVARLCLKITEQDNSTLSKANLVLTYEKLLRTWFGSDDEIIDQINSDSEWIQLLKGIRNEALWHEGGDSHGRELKFHAMKVTFDKLSGQKPKLSIPTFDFKLSKDSGHIRIDDFEHFFDILMHNLFETSIDWLVLAYSYSISTKPELLKSLINGNWIKDNK